MRLYGNRQSRAARCLWLLEELGLSFEQVPVDLAAGEGKAPAYLAVNPAGKVPVLVDGDFVLPESIAINFYLVTRQPTPLWPEAPTDRARVMQWSSWAISELEPPLTAVVRERRAAAAGGSPDASLIASAVDAAAAAMATLEGALAGRTALVGNGFTLADLNATTAAMVAPLVIDMSKLPKSRAWLDRCLARPAWRRVQARP